MAIALVVVTSCLALAHNGIAQSVVPRDAAPDEHAAIDTFGSEGMRYAVVVGQMRDAASPAGSNLAPRLADVVARRLRAAGRFVVLDARDVDRELRERITQNRMPMVRIEGSVTSVERHQRDGQPSVRCQVALILMDERGGALRSVIRGAATGFEWEQRPRQPRYGRLVERALDGAVTSALRGVIDVIDDAAHHAHLPPPADSRLALRR